MHHHRVVVAALAATVALSACGKGGAPKGPPPLNVDVASAKRQDIATYISLDGQIAPLEQSSLAFQQSGTIATINVNVGDQVSAGQVLARIDSSVLQAQYAQASAQARGASIGLPVQAQQNNATLTSAQAALANAKLVYNQNEQLFKQGYVSQATLESARSAYVQAQNAYQNAQVGLKSTDVSAESVKAAQAAANTLATQIGQTTLYAPFSGVITARLLDPGAYAGPQAPVLSISRVDTVWINLNVPDEDLSYVRPGSHVTFSSSSLPGKNFTATIATVNAVPTQGTLSYLARVSMPNPGDVLRGGMLVTATLPQQSHANAIVVPRTAIAQTDKGNAVYVVGADNKAQEVPVRVGIQTDTMSEIVASAVQPGTKVVTTRPDALKDGSLVAVNGAPQPSSSPAATGGKTQ
jgi:HlyD family secretion protein